MTEQTNLPAEVAAQSPASIAKAEMKPGSAIGALVPQSLDDAFRLSKALAMAGDMVPKHFQQKPEMIMAAIVRGMEIGLAPMQALSNIAVINGRSSVWGDALPAMMQRHGHSIDVVTEGEGDKMVATATLTRGDTGQVVVRTFSVEDAKRAGLWGKQGPWQTYPKRMLQMRARSWAVRDGAADALMGLQIAEEVQDYQPIRDVTPKETPLTRLANQARGKTEQPATAPESAVDGTTIDGQAETADEPLQPLTDEEIEREGAPGSQAFDRGVMAQQDGKLESDCPYDLTEARQEAIDWTYGYQQAARAKE